MSIPRLTGLALAASLPFAAPVLAQPPEALQKNNLPNCLKPHQLLASAKLPTTTLPAADSQTVAQSIPSYDPCTYEIPPVRGLW